MRCFKVEISFLSFQGQATVSGILGAGLWLVMATVLSAMKVLVLGPDVKLFLLMSSILPPLRKVLLRAEITPVTLNSKISAFACLV